MRDRVGKRYGGRLTCEEVRLFPSDTLRALGRRWYVLVVGALFTAAGALFAMQMPTVYRAQEVIFFQPPPAAGNVNPLTGVYPSLATTTAAISQRMRSPANLERFRRAGIPDTFEFVPRNTGTVQTPQYTIASMSISVTADDEAAALRSLAALETAYAGELKQLQDDWNVAPDQRIAVSTLVAPSAVLLPTSRPRALIGTGLLGILVSFAAALWLDQYDARRSSSRSRVSRPIAL